MKKMKSYNMGLMVGGPFDGKDHDVLVYPSDYPDGVPEETLNICRVFNRIFPEGAIYWWNGAAWIYQYPMDSEENQGGHRRLFETFGVDTQPPFST